MKVFVAVLFDRWDRLMKSWVSMYKEWTTGWVRSKLLAMHNSLPEIRGATQTEEGRRTYLYTYRYSHNLWQEMKGHTQTLRRFTLMLRFEPVQPSSEHGQLYPSYLYWNAANLCGAQWQRLHLLGNVHSCTAYTYILVLCLQTDYKLFNAECL